MTTLENLWSSVEQLKRDIKELEDKKSSWDSGSTNGGKLQKAIAKRIVYSAKRVETLVGENSYSPR